MDKQVKRTNADLNCATRKLAKLMRANGYAKTASNLEAAVADANEVLANLKAAEKQEEEEAA